MAAQRITTAVPAAAPDPDLPGRSLDLFSGLLASRYARSTCPIHEGNCDGSCALNRTRHVFAPLMSRQAEMAVTTDAAPYDAAASGVVERAVHDGDWVARQKLEAYKYVALSEGMVRVLKIKSAIYRKDVVECEMEDMVLPAQRESKGNAQYAALSYVWGRPVFDRPLICNGQLLWITASLEVALKGWREGLVQRTVGEDGSVDRLWVDAICINQRDTVELNAQLLLMRRIYSHATTVCVDLGDVRAEWYVGFDLLMKLALLYGMEARDPPPVGTTQSIGDLLKKYRLPELANTAWDAYLYIYGSPWFQRTWVVQEIALSAQSTVRFGRFSFEWQSFVKSFEVLSKYHIHMLRGQQPTAIAVGILSMYKIKSLCELAREPTEYVSSLLFALETARNFLVSDPRDKVIAILGLIGNGPTEESMSSLADYSLSTGQVYHRLGAHLVRLGNAMRMLPYAGLHRRSESSDLPTWAPDWNAQSRDFGPPTLNFLRPTPFVAAGSTTPKYQLVEESRTSSHQVGPLMLAIAGGIIGQLRYLGEIGPHPSGNQPDNIQAQNLRLWLQETRLRLNVWSKNVHLRYTDLDEAFARTVLIDHLYTGRNAVARSSPILNPKESYLKALTALERVADGSAPMVETTPVIAAEMIFRQQVAAVCPGKKFGITDTGLICLVSAYSEVGDQVVIFQGASVPFVIRPLERKKAEREGDLSAQLVGDAYVHEMMEGQALELPDIANPGMILLH